MKFIGGSLKITNKHGLTLCSTSDVEVSIQKTYCKPNTYFIVLNLYCNYAVYDFMVNYYYDDELNEMEVFLMGQFHKLNLSELKSTHDIAIWSMVNPRGEFEGIKIYFYYREDKFGKL